MDYRTKPISRDKIRKISNAVRILYGCKNKYFFDAVKALEMTPYYFPNISFEILSDCNPILNGIPATTISDFKGNYSIKVKESVYEKAYYEKNGGCRMHIMHEISHCLLFI